MPQISIIVPVYKVESFLCRCIESILAQTFTDFELILVDDGSPDRCPMICDEYAKNDERIRVIHKKNGGVSSARNAGMKIAQGKYFIFCDSDDYVAERWCESLIVIADKHPNNFVFGGIVNVHEGKTDRIIESQEKRNYPVSDFLTLQTKGKIGFVWNAIFRAKVIQNAELYFHKAPINEDLKFCMDYLKYMSAITYCGYDGYYYYAHRPDQSLSRRFYQDGYKKWREKYCLLHEFIESNVPESEQEFNRKRLANTYMYEFLQSLENTFDKRSTLTFMQKLKYNQQVIQTQEFKSCLQNYTAGKENTDYLKLLQRGNYYIAYLYTFGAKIKRKLFRR